MAMRISRSGGGAAFEVRCRRCEVSFPVGTRKCLHCGGPTAAAGGSASEQVVLAPASDTRHAPPLPREARTADARPIEPEDDVSLRSGTSITQSISESIYGPGPNERELDIPDEPPSVVRSLLSSLGGLVWVILLIGFTLARQCSGE